MLALFRGVFIVFAMSVPSIRDDTTCITPEARSLGLFFCWVDQICFQFVLGILAAWDFICYKLVVFEWTHDKNLCQ